MKKIITFLLVLLLFNCTSTKTFIKNDVLWQSEGKPFKNNYKKGSGRLVKSKRFNVNIKKDN
jgi:hypothetical protein